MIPNDDNSDENRENVRRRSVLAGAGALATGGLVGTVSAGSKPDETVFEGLVHRPLGNATLSTDSRSLTVSNVGDSGEDGVAVETEGASTWGVGTGTTFHDMPAGGEFLTRAYDRDGNACTEARFTRTNSGLEIIAGFRSENDVAIEITDSRRDDVAASYMYVDEYLNHVLDHYDEYYGWLVKRMKIEAATYMYSVHTQDENDEGDDQKQFGVQTSEPVEFAIDGEVVEGDTLTFTELSDGGACSYGEVRNTTVGTDEFTFVSESISE